jgi:hypothetical protein
VLPRWWEQHGTEPAQLSRSIMGLVVVPADCRAFLARGLNIRWQPVSTSRMGGHARTPHEKALMAFSGVPTFKM